MFIAEIGINHNGDLEKAFQLIDLAKRTGADVVKFQKRNPDICVPDDVKEQKRIWQGKEMTYLEYKKLLEFGVYEYDCINNYCKAKGIKWTASVWDVDSVKFMARYKEDIPFIKIPSACITDMELIDAVNELGVAVVMSNGMSTQGEVDNAVSLIDNLKAILHCNSSYPSNENELDLAVIPTYVTYYPNIEIGFSSHCTSLSPIVIATLLGADHIECHITLNKNDEGTDHKASLDENDLKLLQSELLHIKTMLGNRYITCYETEKKVQSKLRRK